MLRDELLTIQEAADTCKISIRTMYRWLAVGRLPAVRIGNVTRIRRTDMETFLENHLSKAPIKQTGRVLRESSNDT